MSYTLGTKLVSEDQEAVVVAVREKSTDVWQIQQGVEGVNYDDLNTFLLDEDLDRRTAVLWGQGEYDDMFITDRQLGYYDEWDDSEDWTHMVTEAEAARQKEVSDKIVALLKEHGMETSDLIVSDGRAYVGYTACANYIETTGAWVPSSMQC